MESLYYEAYEELAAKQLRDICRALLLEHENDGLRHIVVQHRLGHSPIGDTSVIVAVASVHRQAAFAVCAELMDRLKAEVAIWKRETYRLDDGSVVEYEGPSNRCACARSKWKINGECRARWRLDSARSSTQ